MTDLDLTVGLIGTGLMGLPMAQRLLASGVESLLVYNRTPEKLTVLQDSGVAIAPSATAVLQACDVVLLMVSDRPALDAVLLTEPACSALDQCIVVQMGTIAPRESRELAEAIADHGGDYLEAPVLGSIPQVKDGTLQIMVGGSPDLFEFCLPLLQRLGTPEWIGEVGEAATLKLALNQLIASLTTAFATSLSLVQQEGVDEDIFMDILRQSALYAPTFDKKLSRMVERRFDQPNFPTKHLLKDTRLFVQAASAGGIRTDSLEGIQHLLEDACAAGLAELDYSALIAAIAPNFTPDSLS